MKTLQSNTLFGLLLLFSCSMLYSCTSGDSSPSEKAVKTAISSEAEEMSFHPPPFLNHLADIIAISALSEKKGNELISTLGSINQHEITEEQLQDILNSIRATVEESIGKYVVNDQLDASKIDEIGSLVAILTFTEVIGKSVNLDLIGDITYVNRKCIDGQCSVKKFYGYNCRNTKWGCITVKR